MAPEQAAGKAKDVGPAIDVYALGAILYELLTGAVPFQGETPVATLEMVRFQDPVPPRIQQPGVPRDLETICLKCLEKEPARRYTSALDLAEDLRRFLADEPIRARPVTPGERLLKWVRRRRTTAALAGVGVFSLVTLLAVLSWHVHDRRVTADRARDQEQRALAETRTRCQLFLRQRDELLFDGLYGTLFADADAARVRRSVEAAAREALALVGFAIEDGKPPLPDANLGAGERAEVHAGCFQLLLILADVVARDGTRPGSPDRAAERALAILGRAASLVPPTPAYHLRRARYLQQLGDDAGARAERDRAETLRPTSAFDYLLLGQERFQRGQVPEACVEFEKALLLWPDDFWAQFFLGLGRIKQGRPADAAACLTTCAGLRPRFAWTYLVRGRAHEQGKRFDAAEADYRLAEGLDLNPDARYFLHVHRGRVQLRRGQIAEATRDFEQAIALRPDRYHAYLDLARAREQQGRAADGLRQLQEAVRLGAPAAVLADYHAERGYEHYRSRQYGAALDACDQAIQAYPGYAAAHALRGRVLLRLGRHDEAARAFDCYLAQGGEPTADIFRERGLTRMKRGDYAGAADDYGRALERQPDAELYRHRGWAYYFADAWKPALRDFEEAIRRDADNPDGYVGRGLVRVQLGQPNEGVADADEALRRQPTTPEMTYNIACTFALAAGRADGHAADYRARALGALRKTLDLVPAAERPAFWRERVEPDSALDSVRNSTEFRQLARGFRGTR
jgi:tetratricopeptide (TPR) repeat protein